MIPSERLEQVWDPDDFGLHFVRHGELVQLESDGIYLDSVAGAAALSDAGSGHVDLSGEFPLFGRPAVRRIPSCWRWIRAHWQTMKFS